MKPESTLEALYQQWYDLTTAEAHAIETEAWEALADCQLKKADLKLDILRERNQGAPQPAGIRTWLGTLMDMERHNLEALEQHKKLLRQQIAGLDARSRTLHRIRGAYGQPPSRAVACFGTA